MPVNEKGLEAAKEVYRYEGLKYASERPIDEMAFEAAIEAYLRAASKDAEPVAWQYRYWYSSGEPGVWLSERRKDADDLLESGVLIREETRALFTFQPDALVHVDGVTMTPTAAANRIAELSAAQADHSTAIEPVAASPGVGDEKRSPLDHDELLAITEHLMMLADIDDPEPSEPDCTDLCGNRVCDQLGCVVSKWRRVHSVAAPTSPAPSPAGEDVLREPDFAYTPRDWEYTVEWSERDMLTDELPYGAIEEVATLFRGPTKWAAHVATTYDDAGDPDQTEVLWFDSEEEARRALSSKQRSEKE